MSEGNKGFYFDEIRASADLKERVVIKGYAADGFLDDKHPRAALFIGRRPVKALPVTLEVAKLPPLYYRRREGHTMSYMGFFYVDISKVSKRLAESKGARLIVIIENEDKERSIIYKGSMSGVYETAGSYSFKVNDAYVKDGRTYLGGWMGGAPSTVVKIEGLDSKGAGDSVGVDGSARVGNKRYSEPLDYQIEFIPHSEIAVQFPEIEERDNLGFVLSVDGEYKKLRMTMSMGDKKSTSVITTGRSNFDLDSSNNLVRYSGKIARNLKNYGVKETANKIMLHMYLPVLTQNRKYNKWIQQVNYDRKEISEQKTLQKNFSYRPLLSLIVPLYETDETLLNELIESVKNQTYDNWEICFSDGSKDSSRLSEIIGDLSKADKRIKYIAEQEGPLGISENTNQALRIAEGEFVILGDHDDLLYPQAFYHVVEAMNEDGGREIDVVYTDEDKTNLNANRRFEPSIKPDYNQLFLESCNYITHMFVVRKSIVDEIKGFNEKCDGAQDYDFILRSIEKARRVYHINRVLYSWRISSTSTAGNPKAKMYAYDSGVKALQSHYDRTGIKATAEIGDHLGYYHTTYKLQGDPILYAVIVNAESDEKYESTVHSISEKSDFKNIEFIRVKESDGQTYADQLNRGIDEAEILLAADESRDREEVFVAFIEAGVTMMGEDDLSGMLGLLTSRKDIAAAGGKVYCANGTVAHAGVILDEKNVYGYEYMGQSISKDMYFNHSEYSALRRGVTLFRLSDITNLGEFSRRYKGGWSLIDYTLKMTVAGYKCVYCANSNFYINISKGIDASAVFDSEDEAGDESRFYRRNADILKDGDIYYKKHK